MASLRVLPFDLEGRHVAFDTWHDDLQLYLLSDSRDSVSLFDHVSGAAPAPPATADVSTRSQWLSRDATARLAIRKHLPLSAFATVADLVTHLRTSDTRYRATVPAEFLPTNQPPMFITLYFIVTRLPDSLRSVRDHFLTLDPTSLTVALLEQHLLAAETSAVVVGAARGTPRTPFFEGCSPSPLSSSFASAAAADVSVPEDVGAASTSAKRRNSKGKGGRGSGGGSGGGGGGSGSGSGVSGRGGGGGGGGGCGGTGGGGEGSGGGGGGSGGSGGSVGGGTSGGRSGPQRGGPGGGRGQQQQRRSETQTPQKLSEWLVQRGVGEGSETCPYVIRTGARASRTCGSAEGDCYRCVPPDPGIAVAALGASASCTPPGTAPAEALHSFTLDSNTSRCIFRDSTTLTPLPAPVPVRLADPSGGPVVASSSTVLQCPAVPSGSLSGLHLPSFSTDLVSTAALQDAMVTTTTPGGQRVSICTCTRTGRHLATLFFWHHRLGHPSLPRLHGMHSHLLVSSLPRSLSPLPPSPAPPCLPCVEGRQRAAPHSSSFPPTTAPLQTLHMDVWGPACVSGQGRERYFLLVVDDYTRYTTVFPLCSKGDVSAVLIPWIRTVRLQLRQRFGQDLPVLRLHSDRGGEFSSDLLREFCRGEGITQSYTLPDSPQQNGIAERRIGLVMETSPTLHWTGTVGDASVFRVWGSRAFVRDTSADKLSARAIPCVFLGFVPDAPCWQFYHPTSRRVLPSHDVTFNESVPFYRLIPYRSAPPLPPPFFLAPGPPPVAVVSGAAPGTGSEGAGSGGVEPAGVEPGGVESEGAEPGGAESEGAESGDSEPRAGEPRDAGAVGAAITTRAGDPTEPGAAGAGGAGAGVAGVGGPGAGGAGAAGAGAVDPGAGGAGGTVRPHPYFVPLLQQPASPFPVPSPYTKQSGGLTKRREPASRPVSPVRTARHAPRSRPPLVPGTHTMALCPSSVPLHVPLPAPPESSLPEVPDPESDRARAACPTVARLLAAAVTDPTFESPAASALVADLLDFGAACRLDYASALVAESVPACPPSVGGECALGTDVLEDKQEEFECLSAAVPRFASMLLVPEGDPDAPDIPTPRSYAEAITGPYSSQWQATMDAEMASWKSTSLTVKRPPGSPPAFKAHYVARAQLSYRAACTRRSGCADHLVPLGCFLHTQWSLRRPVYCLSQAPREWHDTLRTKLTALGIAPSTADPSLFLRTDTSLPPFYVLVYVDDLVFAKADTEALTLVKSELQKRHTCTDLAPPSDETAEPSGPYPELVGCLMYLMTCTRPDLAYPLSLLACYVALGRHQKVHWDAAKKVLRYLCSTSSMGLLLGGRGPVVLTGHADASWVDDLAMQRSSEGYTFSLGSGSVSWRSTRSSSVLSSSCEAEIYTDLGEQPRSPPILYGDNKAMIALC
ncbi:unnamed protein product [Closterium sp. NIES-53]